MENIHSGPFDASLCKEASISDIDPDRLKWFVRTAQSKRNFPLSVDDDPVSILSHLHLIKQTGITNAALLLFGKDTQQFFVTAEIRCAMFYGNEVTKPIPAYQVYKGDVFQQVNLAVDFIMSRINLYVGDRSQSVDVPTAYEIPGSAVKEAIVNAIAHRDYTSNASVQVMLFRNRLEIWNPGRIPFQLSIPKLKLPHASYPPNPLLAEPMYLAGFIERMGTGIPDMIKACLDAGLKEPELIQEEAFKVVLYRKSESTPHVTPHVKKLLLLLTGEMNREEMQILLDLKDRNNFSKTYLKPALDDELIEMTNPEKPKSSNQKYRLTEKGEKLKQQLTEKRKEE